MCTPQQHSIITKGNLCVWGGFQTWVMMYVLQLVNRCWSSGYRDQRCSSPRILMDATLRHARADYSDKQILWGGGKMEMSVLFIIIKIQLFLCSPLLSPHTHILPPQCWWSQLLKSAICSIIFNYPTIATSIIPLSSILNRNHMLIDSTGQLEVQGKTLTLTVITADWCHAKISQVLPT